MNAYRTSPLLPFFNTMKKRLILLVVAMSCLAMFTSCKTATLQRSDPRYEQIVQEAENEAKEYFTRHQGFFDSHPDYLRPGNFGFCHTRWMKMKKIIKTKHGLDWKTPSEEAPAACFDGT